MRRHARIQEDTAWRPAKAGGAARGQDGMLSVEGLREVFPQWRIFRAGGTWWAMRGGLQEWDGPRSLLLRVISAAGLLELAERLCLQEWLDGLDSEALAAVYAGALMGNPRFSREGAGHEFGAGSLVRLPGTIDEPVTCTGRMTKSSRTSDDGSRVVRTSRAVKTGGTRFTGWFCGTST